MMKYLPSIIAAIMGLMGVFATPIQGFVASHPAIAAVIAALGTIVAHFSPQPHK